MCGIFGIVTNREQALGPVLADAARRLSYRGYDSVGCATIHADRSIDLRKDVGKVDEVASRLGFAEMTGTRGITQLRWATFGDALDGQRPAAPRLRRRPGGRPQRQRGQQRRAAPPVHRRGHDGALGERRRVVRPRRGALRRPRLRHGGGDPPRLRRPAGRLRLRHRPRRRGPALRHQEGLRPGRRAWPTTSPASPPTCRRSCPSPAASCASRTARSSSSRPGGVELCRVADGERGRARARGDRRDHGGGRRRAATRTSCSRRSTSSPRWPASCCTCWTPPRTSPAIVEKMRKARHLYLVGCGTVLPRLHAGRGVPGAAGRACRHPGAGAAVHRPVRPRPRARGRRASSSARAARPRTCSTPSTSRRRARRRAAGAGQRPRLDPAWHGRPLPAAGLRLRDLRAGHQDLHQPGAWRSCTWRCAWAGTPTAMLYDLPGLIEAALQQVEPQIPALEEALLPVARHLLPGLRRDLPHRPGGRAQAQGGHLRPLRGDALHRVQARAALGGVRGRTRCSSWPAPRTCPSWSSGINEVTCRGGRTIVIGEEDPRLRANAHDLLVLPKSGPLFSPILRHPAAPAPVLPGERRPGVRPGLPPQPQEDADGGLRGDPHPPDQAQGCRLKAQVPHPSPGREGELEP